MTVNGKDPRSAEYFQEILKNEHFANFVKLFDRAKSVLLKTRKQVDPGQEMKMKDKLKCRILLQMARTAYGDIPDDVIRDENAISHVETMLDALENLEDGLHIAFDDTTLQYEKTEDAKRGTTPSPKAAKDDDDDEGFNEAEDEHENGKVREFMKVYRHARQDYFRAVFGLEPGKDMTLEQLVHLSVEFTKAEALFDDIPEGIRSELRTRATAGQVYEEIKEYVKCLQEFFDEFLENEVDVD